MKLTHLVVWLVFSLVNTYAAAVTTVVRVIYVRASTSDNYVGGRVDPKINEKSATALNATIENLNAGAPTGTVYKYEEKASVAAAAEYASAHTEERCVLVGHGVQAQDANGNLSWTESVANESTDATLREEIP
ncbi:MAG: hypothetical protein ABIZ81_05470, partial [Opitutaceae bacterium]